MRVAGLLAVFLVSSSPVVVTAQVADDDAAARQPGPPLFRSHEPLTLRIEADFDELKGDRDDDEDERPGTLVIVADDGSETRYPIEVRTRGRFRLQRSTCSFPPLRLDVPRSEMDGTVFENQDKLKLVTHCREGSDFEQNTVEEYLVYRMYNQVTPRSFQVRLVRMTYVDASGGDDPVERWSFLIESDEALAERLGGVALDYEELPDKMVHPAFTRGEDTGRNAIFQYMVGNTDFSVFYGHNMVAVQIRENFVIGVPYDFDWTGFVNASYARPDERLGIRTVRQRSYRGVCRPDVDFAALYADFLARRDDITALVRAEPALGEDEREDALEYLDDFWEIISDPDEARKRIEEECRSI